uniref:Longin domain-containing protein n=2 Tax=Rhodosorus marinus TaxID=101924 RepID=A0A7S2ZMA3_9RHOD|mmetsp:Transcript_23333/g.92854  ORF Transcript_23333/g.92854 Transcript_23333/m.92854 type:complete len:102 (+) Transcript_23333:608-913(+)
MALCDKEYPPRVAFTLLAKVNDDFCALHPDHEWQNATDLLPFPALEETLSKYQNPAEADSIMRMEKDLDETKIILVCMHSSSALQYSFVSNAKSSSLAQNN